LNSEEELNYRELCLFYSLIYVKYWLLAPIAADAAKNDLELYKKILKFKCINPIISRVALEKLKNHLWYVGPELMVFALFSEKVRAYFYSKIIKEITKIL
jgi:hypothetical protein